jgi:uncharacterized RDD family membrane protein YckC
MKRRLNRDLLVPAVIPTPATAEFSRRAGGFLLDLLFMILILIVWVIPDVLIRWVFDASGLFADIVYEITLIGCIVIYIAYPVYFIGKRGQTPGMKRLQIRLFRLGPNGDLYAPTYKLSWGRWAVFMLFNVLSGALFGIPIALDYLWASWDKQRQCLHDKAVGTVAVDEREFGGTLHSSG